LQVRDLWEDFYSNADAVVFMVDSADKVRFNEAKNEIHQILESEELKTVPILVFGNKSDMEVKLNFHNRFRYLLTRCRQESQNREAIIEHLELYKYMEDNTETEDDERTLQVRSDMFNW
jgi:GTPase SAR1 family protein